MIASFQKKRAPWATVAGAMALVVIGACTLSSAQTATPNADGPASQPAAGTRGDYTLQNMSADDAKKMMLSLDNNSGIVSVSSDVPNHISVVAKTPADLYRVMAALAGRDKATRAGGVPRPAERVESLDEKTAAKLNAPIAELKANETPLERIIEFLRDTGGCNITVNWRMLEAAGVTRATPISVQLSGVPLRKALHAVLDDVGVAGVDFVVEDGVITISTAQDLERIAARSAGAPAVDNGAGQASLDQMAAALQQRIEALNAERLQLAQQGANNAGLQQAIDEMKKAAAELQAQLAQRRDANAAPRGTDAAAADQLTQAYDVRMLLDADKQMTVLNADQQNALKDLVRTVATLLPDPRATITGFDGVLLVRASHDSQAQVQELLGRLEAIHNERRAQQEKPKNAAP